MRALEFAGEQQQICAEVSIRVLYVQTPLPPSRFVTRSMIAQHFSALSRAALTPARAIIKRQKLNARTESKVGDPAAIIVQFAKKHRCGQIVMGNSGRGRIAGLLLGSVAAKVIQLAPCPVTVVK
jgi:nucleotide-binding universal stress UspA family protein